MDSIYIRFVTHYDDNGKEARETIMDVWEDDKEALADSERTIKAMVRSQPYPLDAGGGVVEAKPYKYSIRKYKIVRKTPALDRT